MINNRDIELIIFDLDGTLLDSKTSVVEAVYYIAQKYSPNQFTYSDIEDRFGEPLDDFLKILHYEDQQKMYEDYMAFIGSKQQKLIKLFPNIKEDLEALKKEGYRLAIATNKQRELTIEGLKKFAIEQLFDIIVCLEDVEKGKPDPEMLKLICGRLDVKPQNTIMVGDSIFDLQAAKAVNIQVVLLDWYDEISYTTVKEWNPDYVLKKLQELSTKVLGISYGEKEVV